MSAEEEGLELTRWGTRFARSGVEAAYTAWHARQTRPTTRVGMVGSLIAWAAGWAALAYVTPEHAVDAGIPIGLVMVPAIVAVLVATGREAWSPWVLPVTAVTNAIAGFVVLEIATVAFSEITPMFTLGGIVIASYFGLTVFRTPAKHAGAAVGSYIVAYQVVLARWLAAGAIDRAELVVSSVVAWTALLTGLLACIVLERMSHAEYRQERIIEAQKETIARERARSESLLRQELAHQVAARSRELGRMLARVDATLVAGRPRAGERFDTRYRVERELGAGAMGAVFAVARVTDGQTLALKVVTGEISGDRAARFAREAEIGARVRHPNVVEILDVGIAEGGVPYLVMELAPDGSLESSRERFGDAGWARPHLAGIARGLCALHEAGIVHRDLKPANVLLVGGVPKISDFGISRFGELGSGDTDPNASTLAAARPQALTATGMLLGTPYYMAPEAVRGAHVEAPADVFAFGILAVEMLTGRAPFTVPPMFRALAGERLETPIGLDRVGDASHRELLRTCLAEDPAARPTMRAVRDALAPDERSAGEGRAVA